MRYPTACSPQAWATGTPLLLLRVLLGLRPDGDELGVDPHPGDGLLNLALHAIPYRGERVDARAQRPA